MLRLTRAATFFGAESYPAGTPVFEATGDEQDAFAFEPHEPFREGSTIVAWLGGRLRVFMEDEIRDDGGDGLGREQVIFAMASAWWNQRRGVGSRVGAGSPPWRDAARNPYVECEHALDRARKMLDDEPLPTPITRADDAMYDVALILGAMKNESR